MRTLILLLLLPFLSVAQAPTPIDVGNAIAADIAGLQVPPQPVASVRDLVIGNGTDSATLRIYQPAASGKLPVVYFIHGGAWVGGDLETHDNICRVLANRLQAIVVAVAYRRPPEHLFPTSNNDVLFGLQWVARHASEWGGNGRLVVLGDSAGGLLAAAACQANAASGQPVAVAAQVLVNPALDLRPGSPTDTTYHLVIGWGTRPDQSRADVRLSPLAATRLSGLPTALIVVGSDDEIRSDGIRYDARLREAGVRSTLFVQPQMGHLGPLFAAAHPKAAPAIDFIVAQLQQQELMR